MKFRFFRNSALAALAVLATLAGCGGGSGGSSAVVPAIPPVQTTTGDLVVTLTDAEGDFVAYIVDVTSIRLRRANGDLVETLPLTTRVDFTQLTEVSEFLTVATVPVGTYQEVILTLDYSNAEVLVQGDDGEPVAAQLVDASGDPLTTLDVTLTLDDADVIRITQATVRAFSLDFDLDASNSIDATTTPPTVTVEPVLLAMPELEEDREHRARGLLAEVDEVADEVTLNVRPFRHRTGAFGHLTFAVDADTIYEIDGIAYSGEAGLAALADLADDTPVVAQGLIENRELVAVSVLAGSSVAWSDAEVVRGVVTARDADSLTLRGVAVEFADGRFSFRQELTVLVGDATLVAALGVDAGDLDQLSISVGQAIVASGEFADDLTLDATRGRVRMLVNRVWGDVVSVDPLVVDLQLLNGRRPAIFDFTGTGVTGLDDADPNAYEIDTATLGLLQIELSELVQVRGLVNRFGFAPPDFLGRTVVDVATATRGATARVAWPEGSSVPFVASAQDRLDLDLTGARVVVNLKGRIRHLAIEPDMLALTAPAAGRGIYAVVQRGAGTLTVYRNFADAVEAMVRLLDEGASLHRLTAHGRYTEDSDELTAARASFVFGMADSAEQ
ncbi:MAG: DUF4382 domain-containing protein [Pseudomonadales bacterium]|nr:DUF4382 domain-containing protein [Pseudomonadales bacterium]